MNINEHDFSSAYQLLGAVMSLEYHVAVAHYRLYGIVPCASFKANYIVTVTEQLISILDTSSRHA